MNNKNLLFIMCDQQRYDCVGFSKIRPVKTPNIDKIAQNGVWFKNAYTPIPVCAPARQSIICGKRPEYFGGLWNFGITHPVCEVPVDGYIYPRHLKENGYNTAFCGKWNISASLPPGKYGFDISVSDGVIYNEINKKYADISISYPNGNFGDPCPIALEDSHTHVLAKKTNEIINNFSKQNKPWFVNMDFGEPHLPCRPSAPFDTMYKPEDIEKWGGFDDDFHVKPYMHKQQVINWNLENRTWEEWSRTVALYYGYVSQYDDAIGRILQNLEATGQLENTVIIYTCDHGDMCGSHRMIDKHYVMYEDLVHVPFIIRCDSLIKPQIFEGYVHNCLDVVPTILDLLDIEKPVNTNTLHGESLAPALISGEKWDRDYAVSSYNGQQFGLYSSRCIKIDGWKYVWNLSDIDELYDLTADPFELNSIIYDKSKSELIAQLRIKLYNELEKCRDPMISWTKDQLLKGRKI
ncbi:MAG: sulfatase-like hydrolase/transferase [Oscillospiraceae bacterium]|nr:sulfatase-like hydrolase/transferase [Oscillospiraceae bacterium]